MRLPVINAHHVLHTSTSINAASTLNTFNGRQVYQFRHFGFLKNYTLESGALACHKCSSCTPCFYTVNTVSKAYDFNLDCPRACSPPNVSIGDPFGIVNLQRGFPPGTRGNDKLVWLRIAFNDRQVLQFNTVLQLKRKLAIKTSLFNSFLLLAEIKMSGSLL